MSPRWSPRKVITLLKNEGWKGLVLRFQDHPFFARLAASISSENWPVFPSILTQNAAQADPEGPRLMMFSHELSLSGAPLMLWMLAKHLLTLRPRYRIQVLSSRSGPLEAVFNQAGVSVIIHRNIVLDSRLCAQYMLDQDLVVANTIVTWRAVVAAKALGKPCLWWIHESKYGWRQAHFNKNIARAFSLAQKVVFPCEATRRLFESFSSSGNYMTIHNGLEWGTPENREEKILGRSTDGTFKLVSVGSIEPRKGQDILLKALRGLPREIQQQTECLLVGRCLDPHFRKKLLKLSAKLKKVHLLGEVPRDQIRWLLRDGDVFILPSRDEVFPTSLLEALAEGKGVIAAEVGGVAEIVEHERQGLLFKAGDHGALARHITRFFEDREFLQACGARGRGKFVENFTFERFAQKMEEPINSLLGLNRRPPGKNAARDQPL